MKYLLFSLILLIGSYLFSTIVIEIFKKRKKRDLSTPFSVDITTICKGASIVLIMLAHVGNCFGIRYLNPLGSWGVAVFLFASGYGLERSYQKNGFTDYWKKRIKTAYLPYVLIEVVNCTFNISYKIKGEGFLEIVQDFLLIKPLHPFGWYMQCLFLHYIFFYIACIVSKKKNIFKNIVLVVVAISMFVFADSLFKQQMFSFMLGVLVGQYYDLFSKYVGKLYVSVLALAFGGGLLLLKQLPFVRDGQEVAFYLVEALQVLGLMVFLVTFVHVLCEFIPSSFLEVSHWIGVLSNELYLIHGLVFVLVISPKDISYHSLAMFFVLSFVMSIVVFMMKKFFNKIWSTRI